MPTRSRFEVKTTIVSEKDLAAAQAATREAAAREAAAITEEAMRKFIRITEIDSKDNAKKLIRENIEKNELIRTRTENLKKLYPNEKKKVNEAIKQIEKMKSTKEIFDKYTEINQQMLANKLLRVSSQRVASSLKKKRHSARKGSPLSPRPKTPSSIPVGTVVASAREAPRERDFTLSTVQSSMDSNITREYKGFQESIIIFMALSNKGNSLHFRGKKLVVYISFILGFLKDPSEHFFEKFKDYDDIFLKESAISQFLIQQINNCKYLLTNKSQEVQTKITDNHNSLIKFLTLNSTYPHEKSLEKEIETTLLETTKTNGRPYPKDFGKPESNKTEIFVGDSEVLYFEMTSNEIKKIYIKIYTLGKDNDHDHVPTKSGTPQKYNHYWIVYTFGDLTNGDLQEKILSNLEIMYHIPTEVKSLDEIINGEFGALGRKKGSKKGKKHAKNPSKALKAKKHAKRRTKGKKPKSKLGKKIKKK
jgi:hypothetical protein